MYDNGAVDPEPKKRTLTVYATIKNPNDPYCESVHIRQLIHKKEEKHNELTNS